MLYTHTHTETFGSCNPIHLEPAEAIKLQVDLGRNPSLIHIKPSFVIRESQASALVTLTQDHSE